MLNSWEVTRLPAFHHPYTQSLCDPAFVWSFCVYSGLGTSAQVFVLTTGVVYAIVEAWPWRQMPAVWGWSQVRVERQVRWPVWATMTSVMCTTFVKGTSSSEAWSLIISSPYNLYICVSYRSWIYKSFWATYCEDTWVTSQSRSSSRSSSRNLIPLYELN